MYKVVGADRKEYGPVARETILEWIAQGRANAQTIARFEDGAWKPLATFDEFKEALGTARPPTTDAGVAMPPVATTATYSSAEPPPFSGIGSKTETNVASVLGIVFSIICCCCPYIGPILGILFSAIGWSQIRSNPHRYTTSDILPKIGMGISIAILILHIVFGVLDAKLAQWLPKPPFNI